MNSAWEPHAKRSLDDVMNRLQDGEFNTSAPGVINAVVRFDQPTTGFTYEKAIGCAYANADTPMTTAHQFHIASVAKPMTAILILQALEEGRLGTRGLDANLLELGVFEEVIVDRLQMMNGVSYGKQVTLRHLLMHTSGMKEAVGDDAGGTSKDYGQSAPESYGARYRAGFAEHLACLQDPDCDPTNLPTSKNWNMWDPKHPDDREAGTINWFLATGTSAAALWPPGERFYYSDTGYIILGLVAETIFGQDLHRLWRDRIFDPLSMDHSYLAYAQDPVPDPWIHDVSDFFVGDIGCVTSKLNVSFDRGGGGVVSTVADLNKFQIALLQGKLFQNPETLVQMTQWRDVPGIEAPRAGVGLGIFGERTDYGTVVIGHSGAYGTKMYYEPETGIYFSGTVNQRLGVPYYWWKPLFRAIHEARGM
jgi:D-alanyl-D-alanine carboxypeptidase